MTDAPPRAGVQRIIVGWQSHASVDFSLEAATLLASATKAEVVGLFVENDELIELAGVPFVRLLSPGLGRAQPVTRESIAAAYARGAAECRRLLSSHAEKAQVKWSFSSERGELPAKIRSYATAEDFVVLTGDVHGFGAKQLMNELRSSPTHIKGILIAGLRTLASRTGLSCYWRR